MALTYLHVPARYARIVHLLRTTPFGAPFRNLQHLEALGVSVLIERGEVDTLRRHLASGLPPLVPVETRWLTYWPVDTYHVVVVVGMEADRVYVNDPYFEAAPQIVSLNEFVAAWVEQNSLYAVIGLEAFES